MRHTLFWPSLSLAAFCLAGCAGDGANNPAAVTVGSSLSASSFHIDISSASSSVDVVVDPVVVEFDPYAPPEFLKQAPVLEGRKRIADIPFKAGAFANCVYKQAAIEGALYADQLQALACVLSGKQLHAAMHLPHQNFWINDLSALEHFTQLESLVLVGGWIAQMDFSIFTKLKHLSIRSYPIKSLDLTKNSQLESLSISDAPMSVLNMTGLSSLKSLNISSPLTAQELRDSIGSSDTCLVFDDFYLGLSIENSRENSSMFFGDESRALPEFLDLTCADYVQPLTIQGLDELDLESLWVSKTQIAGNPTLRANRDLRVYDVGDAEVDVSSPELEVLVLEKVDNLERFTVPAAPKLKGLKLNTNAMVQVDFALSEYPALREINFSGNKLTNLSLPMRLPALTHASFRGNQLAKGLRIPNSQPLELLNLSSAFAPGASGSFNEWVSLSVPEVSALYLYETSINAMTGVVVKNCYADRGGAIPGCRVDRRNSDFDFDSASNW